MHGLFIGLFRLIISPVDDGVSPAIIRKSVDLPAPDLPKNETISPLLIDKFIFSST